MDYRYTASIEVLKFDSVRVMESGTTNSVVVITDHGCQNTDFMYNFTRATNPPNYLNGETGRRKVINATTSQFEVSTSISGQTAGDICFLYKFTDVTQYLLDSTLKLSIQAQGESNASFSLKAKYTPGNAFYVCNGYNNLYVFDEMERLAMPVQTWSLKLGDGLFRYRHNVEGDKSQGKLWTLLGETGTTSSITTATFEYNQNTDAWIDKTMFIDSFRTAAHSAFINDNIYVNGGVTPLTANYFADTYKFDPTGDSWTSLTDSIDAGSSGEGINLCDCLVVAYYKRDDGGGGSEFAPDDCFYMPLVDTWATIPVTHSSPDRCFGRSSFTIDNFKGSIIGGSTNITGSDADVIDYHTMLNLPAKSYSEAGPTPFPGMEYGSSQYENYAIICGGVWNGTFWDTGYIWNSARDNWVVISDTLSMTKCGFQGASL